MNRVLVVMDLQNVYVGKNHHKFFKYEKELIDNVNEIIKKNENVIYVRNLMKNNFLNRLLPFKVFAGRKEADLADELLLKNNLIFDKYKPSAFTNIEFVKYLNDNNIDTLEIIGIDGGGCVSLTALDAVKRNYKVIINTNCVGTMFKKNQQKLFAKLKKNGATFIE